MSRSIIITFEADDATISSDLAFLQKLNDLRERYPAWHIRGVVHGDGQSLLVPTRPKSDGGSAKLAESQSDPPTSNQLVSQLDFNTKHHTSDDRFGASLEDVESEGSDESDGNVVGEHPRTLVVGLKVRMLCHPYEGCVGAVVDVKGNRIKVQLAPPSVSSWWCVADEVVVVAVSESHLRRGEAPVAKSTVEYISQLERKVAELEEEVGRLKSRQSAT